MQRFSNNLHEKISHALAQSISISPGRGVIMQRRTVGGRYTPCVQLLSGLRESLNMLMSEGIPNVVKRHNRCGQQTTVPPTAAAN